MCHLRWLDTSSFFQVFGKRSISWVQNTCTRVYMDICICMCSVFLFTIKDKTLCLYMWSTGSGPCAYAYSELCWGSEPNRANTGIISYGAQECIQNHDVSHTCMKLILNFAITLMMNPCFLARSLDNSSLQGMPQRVFPCQGCGTSCGILTAPYGTLSDGSGRNLGYQNNAQCEWLIAPPGATNITVTFTEFDAQLDFDFVQIRQCTDLRCLDTQLLGVLSGSPTNLYNWILINNIQLRWRCLTGWIYCQVECMQFWIQTCHRWQMCGPGWMVSSNCVW